MVMETSRYHGVVGTADDRWAAVMFRDGEPTLLGIYDDEATAASVYDTVAFAMLGSFAILNFPDLAVN